MRPMIRILPLLLAAALGCGGGRGKDEQKAPAADAALVRDATVLGRELYDLLDRVMSYKSSHFNRLPRSLTEVGIDTLTPTTIRRLSVADGVPTITLVLRRPEGRAVTQCWGSAAILEDAMLNSGAYSVDCAVPSGVTTRVAIEQPALE